MLASLRWVIARRFGFLPRRWHLFIIHPHATTEEAEVLGDFFANDGAPLTKIVGNRTLFLCKIFVMYLSHLRCFHPIADITFAVKQFLGEVLSSQIEEPQE